MRHFKRDRRAEMEVRTMIILAAIIIIFAPVAYVLLMNPSPSYTSYGTMSDADYVVYKSGTETTAVSGIANGIDYTSSDSGTVIQNCIDRLATLGGGLIVIKSGDYSIASTITLTHSNIWIRGAGSNIDDASGTNLVYSGIGTCLNIHQSPLRLQSNQIQDLNIVAAGAAISSPSAVGLWINTTELTQIQHVTMRDFEQGTAMKITCDNGPWQYTAAITIRDCFIFNCADGVFMQGESNGSGVNTVSLYNTIIIGNGVTSHCAVYEGNYTWTCLYEGGDIETYENAYIVYGYHNQWIHTRTEAITGNHFTFLPPSIANDINDHAFYSHGDYFNGSRQYYPYTSIENCPGYRTESWGYLTFTGNKSMTFYHDLGYWWGNNVTAKSFDVSFFGVYPAGWCPSWTWTGDYRNITINLNCTWTGQVWWHATAW